MARADEAAAAQASSESALGSSNLTYFLFKLKTFSLTLHSDIMSQTEQQYIACLDLAFDGQWKKGKGKEGVDTFYVQTEAISSCRTYVFRVF